MIELYSESGVQLDYTRLVFAGGELHVNVADITQDGLIIKGLFRNSDDIMEMLILNDALTRNGCDYISLEICYLPYARQDRVCTKGDAFSLKVMTDLINSCNFYGVSVHDCHSDVGLDLLNSMVDSYSQLEYLIHTGYTMPLDAVVVAPDAGAFQKSKLIAEYYGLPLLVASKVREPETGKLTGFAIDAAPEDIKGKQVYIFDDICDGGGTFLGLGKIIQEMEPTSMTLYVTNGIYSNEANKILLEDMFNLESTFAWN